MEQPELTEEQKAQLAADRHLVENTNQQVYQLYVKVMLTLASGVLLGSSATSIPERSNYTLLLISWAFMAATLIIILSEMVYSMKESGRYADKLAEYSTNAATIPTPPDNKTIETLILASLITFILGIILLLLSLAIPHLSPCQNLP